LIEGYGVGVDVAESLEGRGGVNDEVVDDADVGLRDDGKAEAEEVIVVLVDGAVEGVFYRDYGVVDLGGGQGLEDFFEAGSGVEVQVGAQELAGGLLTEGAALALKCYASVLAGAGHFTLVEG